MNILIYQFSNIKTEIKNEIFVCNTNVAFNYKFDIWLKRKTHSVNGSFYKFRMRQLRQFQ